MSRVFASIVTSVLASCGNGGTAGPDAAVTVPLLRAPSAYAAAYCERVFGCCAADEVPGVFPGAQPPVTDPAGCREYIARVFGNEFVSDTQRAEAEGHARYDGVAMAACLDHLRGDACDHLARVFRLTVFPEECLPVRIPLAGVDTACDHDFQCTTGYCEGGAENQTGTCRLMPALGEVCPDSRCAPGLYCDRTADPAGRCAALKAAGEPCSSLFECLDFACSGAPSGVCDRPSTCDGLP